MLCCCCCQPLSLPASYSSPHTHLGQCREHLGALLLHALQVRDKLLRGDERVNKCGWGRGDKRVWAWGAHLLWGGCAGGAGKAKCTGGKVWT